MDGSQIHNPCECDNTEIEKTEMEIKDSSPFPLTLAVPGNPQTKSNLSVLSNRPESIFFTTVVPSKSRKTPLLAEALAFRLMCFETDSLQLYQCWHRRTKGRSYLDSIVRDCRFLATVFDFISFSFVRCTGNAVADFLARNASTYANSVWVEVVPHAAISIVDSDVMTSLPVNV
ncbi:uncharacterized protein LOC130746065 [Lotus japonicus]|uniref:uncharacterized protein LOC130746065 n=1 Tax=Lotus japonicus TaxID=34305 RepID=UPI0025839296|nr:uncharacterized protein LOC130746065 [Lotus japonicus]